MDDKFEELRNAADFIKNNEYLPAAKCYANAAELMEKAGNIEEAELIFQNIIECYEKEADSNIKQRNFYDAAEILLSAGELKSRLNQEDLAKKYYEKAVQQFLNAAEEALKEKNLKSAGDYFKKAAFHLEEIEDKQKSIIYYQNAIDCYQKFVTQSLKKDDLKTASQITQIIALLYERIGNYEKAIELDEEALEMAKNGEFIQIITDCYLHIAHCFFQMDKKIDMIDALKTAKDYNINNGKRKMQNNEYLEAAECFDNAILILKELAKLLDDNNEILEELHQSYISEAECYLKVAESDLKLNEIDRAAHFQRNAALCYRMINKHKKSAEIFLKAGNNFEKVNAQKLASINFRDAGLQYELIKEPETAAKLLHKAAELAKSEGPIEISLECYRATLRNYGYLDSMIKYEELLEELEELLKSLAKEEEIEENFHIAASYLFEIGNYYDTLNKPKKAEIYYNKAIQQFEKAVAIAIKEKQLTIGAYSLCCLVILKLILNDTNIEPILERYRKDISQNHYFIFSLDLYNAFITEKKKILGIIEKYEHIIKHSDELDYLISKLIEKIKN